MNSAGFTSKLATAAAVALLLVAWGGQQACAQMGAGDIVVGKSQGTSSFGTEQTFFAYDASAGTWSNGPGWSIGGSVVEFIQSVEFDNSGGNSHNASGNLLGANFGNSFSGFEIYNFATDGSANAESLWSIVEATGGTKGTDPACAWFSQRGGGVSVSPDNLHLAWANGDTDAGQIYVHDYDAGSAAGSGAVRQCHRSAAHWPRQRQWRFGLAHRSIPVPRTTRKARPGSATRRSPPSTATAS